MTHKKTIGILLSFSVVGFLAGIILTEPETFGTCREEYLYEYGEEGNLNNPVSKGCMDPLGDVLGQPLGMLSFVLGVVFLVLFFLHQSYFKTWFKFAAWYIPVAILWIFTTSDNVCREYLPMCFDKELATWWSSGIYLVLSLVVVAFTYFKRRSAHVSAVS